MTALLGGSDSKAVLRLSLISLGSLCSISLCYLYYSSMGRTRKRPLPPPTYSGWIPFVGVALPFFKDVNAYLHSRLRRHPGGPFRLYFLGNYWTFVYDLEDIRSFFNSPEASLSFLQAYKQMVSPTMPKQFDFKPRTQFFSMALNVSMMQHYLAIMVEEAQRQVSLLGSAGEVDLFRLGQQLTMTMNLRCIFGSKILDEHRVQRYHQAFNDIDPEKGLVDVFSALLSPSKKEEAWKVFGAVTLEIIEYYRDVVDSEGPQSGDGDDDDELLGPPECLVHFVMRKHAGKGVALDEANLIEDIFAFIFASYTNTFAALAWTLWHSAVDKTLAGELLKDVQGMDLKRLTSLDGWSDGKDLVDEVVRMHTPGIFLRKVMDPQGHQLSTGHVVPCGEIVAVSARHLLQREEFYQDPGTFRPSRYSQGGTDERKAAGMYWVAWGSGKHPCLGSKFANYEVLVALGCLLSVFDIHPVTQDVRVSPSQMGTLEKPMAPVILAYAKRNGGSGTSS